MRLCFPRRPNRSRNSCLFQISGVLQKPPIPHIYFWWWFGFYASSTLQKKKNTPSMFVSGVCACITLQTGVFVVRNWKALPSCGGARVFFFRRLHGCRIETLGLNNGWIWFVFWCCVMQSTVDKLIKKTNLALVVGTNSWRDQFMEAITVSAGNVVCSLRHYKS